jgi:hypothetical protein
MNITQKLDQLAEIEAEYAAVNLMYADLKESIMGQEIIDKLADLDAERQSKIDRLLKIKEELTAKIKADILTAGQSFKGAHLQALYVKGRVSWDTKALDGYAIAHPEIAPMRKEGDPSVSIRAVK